MCKNLTSYIFSLYLKAPQTWYNLFPSTSSILLVLFISSLLAIIPVVFFSFKKKIILQFCALECLAIFRKHFAFSFGFFYIQKTRRSKNFQFFLSPSDGNSPWKTSCDVLHDNQHVQNFLLTSLIIQERGGAEQLAKWPLSGAPTLRPFYYVFNTMALNLGPSLQMEEKGKYNNEARSYSGPCWAGFKEQLTNKDIFPLAFCDHGNFPPSFFN